MVDVLTGGLSVKLSEAMMGYGIAWVLALIIGLILWRPMCAQIATFVIVTNGLFIAFLVTFFGVGHLMLNVWQLEPTLGFNTIVLISLACGVLMVLLPYIPLKILLAPYVSTLELELENLDERFMTPLDYQRQQTMARKRKNRF